LKEILKKFTGKSIYLLFSAIFLFVVTFLLNRYVAGSTSANYYARLIENDIQKKEADFSRIAVDTALIKSLVNRSYNESTFERMLDKNRGYLFFVYRPDTATSRQLLFWNTQVALPPINFMDETDASRMVRVNNGYYVQISKSIHIPADNQTYHLEALIPVLAKYFVEIANLKTEFVSFPDAIYKVDIAFNETEYPVKSSYGNVLFHLQKNSENQQQTSWWTIVMVMAGVFLLFIYIHQSAHYLSAQYGLWRGVAFLVAIVLTLRLITYYFPGILDLRQFQLFDPAIYSSSFVLSSLGDLFINAGLICWIVLFISRRMSGYVFRRITKQGARWLVVILSITLLVVCTFVFADIIQSLVADAQISFNVTNFFSLTPYSFIGFAILAVLALSYFLVAQIVLGIIKQLSEGPWYISLIIAAVSGLTILSFASNPSVVELNLFVLAWLILFIWAMQQKVFSGINFRLNISEVLFWLFVFSFSIAAVIISENRKIEFEQRLRFAEKISYQADPSSERLLSIALAYLDNDFLAPNVERFKDPGLNNTIKDSIINKNFSAYLNKFDTRIFTFDHTLTPLYNEDPVSYDTLNTIYNIQGKPTNINNLRYFEKSFDKYAYIFKREVNDKLGNTIAHFFVLSEPKRYKSEALIPELFKQSKEYLPEYSPVYSYGIYSNYELINYHNDYPFPTELTQDQVPKTQYVQKQNNSYEELWYRYAADKVVVVAKKGNSLLEAITLFAYLFSTFILLLSLYRLMALLIRSRLKLSILRQYWQLSIRSQIHSTVILVSLLSFVVIGVATILFFINRYDRNNQDRLSRAMNIMVKEVQNKLAEHQTFDDEVLLFESGASDEVEALMQEISEIHGTDVNLYDTVGNLRVSSNPFVYNKGVLSEKMNPVAFYQLSVKRAVQYVGEEQMGKVDYFSIYSPVRDEQGTAYAYLNIPFFSTQVELKQEISNFLVTIINLNAFIFLVSGAIALFITNRITSSFTIIGQKMRDINLQKINQEIQWKRNDEIGELVKEYNKMVHKLDESAEAMAKSEREGAWRQMARQVAHEIKNPLTPMKLSIQYLQKAIDNNSSNVKEMTANVARTLIEQIDHLSKIASDFSQFANIGNPRNEVFDLHELLYSLTSLYESTENLDLAWKPVQQRVMLFADKTQLNRLFTNLFQNAIEAEENRTDRIIYMEEHLNGDYITITIRDNGGGIPEQMRDKIFMPNFTTKSSGTGLGLAMSKSIAEQAHGDIWFETEEGEGTTFYVKLPLLRAMN
jgi:two-component system, NtrC family, nitrogen regulation sensor histidine kinase NtrY